MPRKKYIVDLSEEERTELLSLTGKGTLRARKMKRALILLKADEGLTDARIMTALGVSRPCVERVRQRFVEGNLPRALNDNPHPGPKRKLTGREEWCIPAVNAELVAAMEDVLELYEEPPDPERPKVCFDETPKQLIAETRVPLPARPGQPERFDYESQWRHDMSCLYSVFNTTKVRKGDISIWEKGDIIILG